MDLNISVSHQEQIVIVTPHDKSLNQEKAPALKELIYQQMADGYVNMVVDLAEVRDIDSSGLGAFLFGKRLANNNEGELVLARAGKFVQNLLRIAHLTDILKTFPTVEEAIAYLQLPQEERENQD